MASPKQRQAQLELEAGLRGDEALYRHIQTGKTPAAKRAIGLLRTVVATDERGAYQQFRAAVDACKLEMAPRPQIIGRAQ